MKRLTKYERIYMAFASFWLFICFIIYLKSTQEAEIINSNPINKELLSLSKPDFGFPELLMVGVSPFVLFTIYIVFLKKN
ncbi:MAG: hypothetical protein WCP74_12505 [Sphingobacteriia bacterium]